MTMYKVKNTFLLKDICGEKVAIARGNFAIEFNGTIVLNDTGAFLWEKLDDYCSVEELAESLSKQYSIDGDLALNDTKSFIKKMLEYELLEYKE